MKLNALRTYVCPLSKGQLSLHSFEEHEIELSPPDIARAASLGIAPGDLTRVVKTGVLSCDKSRKWYPIINYVPLFIDYPTEIHQDFLNQYRPQRAVFSQYELPNGRPRPGEATIRRTFTKEWATLQLENLSFGLTPEQRDFFVHLELDWPEQLLPRRDLKVLEVGCGSGFESLSLDRVTQGDIYGFDLNVTLLRNGEALSKHPFVNVANASLFALPVEAGAFDIVYSSGVLHHTHSTKVAFDEILQYRKDDGLIYIWVYALEDSDYSIKGRLDWIVEDIVRPRIAAAGDFWQNLIVRYLARRHFKRYKKAGGYSKELWTMADSEHSMRDRWTALFAHRHSFIEVIRWILDSGLEYRLIDPKKYYDHFNVSLIGVGIRGIPHEFTGEAQSEKLVGLCWSLASELAERGAVSRDPATARPKAAATP
jgi:SAM-dependent methyltransferase